MKIILSILAVVVVLIALLFYFTSGLTGTANEQLASLKSGNIETAYSMTSKDFQNATSLNKFKIFVEQNPVLKNYKSVSFTDRKVETGSGYLGGTIENADGVKTKIEYQLVKEGDKWKIQAMQLSPIENK